MPKPYKIFLSYSHKDENTASQLKNHLSTLIHNEEILFWYDRELLAGSELELSIKKKLNESDIFIFLVSSDFIASYYCINIELESVLQRKAKDPIQVLPLIARECDWKESSLGQFTAIPQDGKPLSNQRDLDIAFTACVEEIKKVIKFLEDNKVSDGVEVDEAKSSAAPITINSDFEMWLDNTEVVFQHRGKDEINLHDIYVYPDLEVRLPAEEESSQQVILNSRELGLNRLSSNSVLVLGSEQSGKSSLAKSFFKDLFSANCLPLFFDSTNMPTNIDVEKLLRKVCEVQYENLDEVQYKLCKLEKIAILDNFESLKLNVKYTKILLEELLKYFDRLIVIADSEISFDDANMEVFDGFESYEILRFGYSKREELISKWNSIGVTETIREAELESLNRNSSIQIDSQE